MRPRRRRPPRGARRLPAALTAATAAAIAASCAEPPPPPEAAVRPVRYAYAQAVGSERTATFSGVAHAAVESTLSFRVPGTVAEVSVEVGDPVRAGSRIADLDPVDYELQVREAEASLREAEARAGNAEASLRRMRNLYESDNAARTDLDVATAAAISADAQVESVRQRLDMARRQVGYTHLTAPVAGAIAEVLVEINENVAQGQPVVVLASGGAPEVDFVVPEARIREIREGMPVSVAFDAIPDQRFEAVVTEVGVTTGTTGTTFPVTVRLGAEASDIRSGMAAVIDIVFRNAEAADRYITPPHAVGEDRGGRFVYVAEPAGDGMGVVRRQAVAVGGFAPGGLEIVDGLSGGERIVVAGINQLQEGDRVRLDADGER